MLSTADRCQVEKLAYSLWQNAGCPDGQDWYFWFEALNTVRKPQRWWLC